MKWGELAPYASAVLTAIAALFAGFTKMRTSNVQLVFDAQQKHMETLTEENKSLRNRQDTQQREIADLQSDRAECERDKKELRQEIRKLKEQINRG